MMVLVNPTATYAPQRSGCWSQPGPSPSQKTMPCSNAARTEVRAFEVAECPACNRLLKQWPLADVCGARQQAKCQSPEEDLGMHYTRYVQRYNLQASDLLAVRCWMVLDAPVTLHMGGNLLRRNLRSWPTTCWCLAVAPQSSRNLSVHRAEFRRTSRE